MAVGMLLAGEGVTEASYKQLTEAMFGSYPMRQGPITRGAACTRRGPGDQGWYIYDIWESPEHFQRFAEEKLRPAMESTGAGGGAQPQPQFYPIETLVRGPAL